MGGDRLRAHLRRVPAARRPGSRPARPQAPVHGRAGDLHRGLARLRAGHQRHLPDHHARHPGPGRRRGAARRAVHRDEHVQRGRRTQQGARRLGWHRRHGGQRRPAGRRLAHPVRRLAVHLLPERPDRRGRPHAGPPGRAGKQAARRAPALRPARRHHRDRRPRRLGLRDLAGVHRRMDRHPDPGPARGGCGPARRLPGCGDPG